MPPRAGQALSAQDGAGDRRRGPAGRLPGATSFAEFAALLSQEQLEAVGAFFSPSRQRYTAPAITTFHNILAALPPDTLDNAIGRWTAQQGGAHAPVAMDGKDLRGASAQIEEGRRMMVAAVEHKTGMVLGQVEVDAKTNEIPAVRKLSTSLDLAGRIASMYAMHAQHETARCLLGRRADYVLSAIEDNQGTILEDLKAIDFSDAPSHETVDKGRVIVHHLGKQQTEGGQSMSGMSLMPNSIVAERQTIHTAPPPPLQVESSHSPAFTVRTAACRPAADRGGAEPHPTRDRHDGPQQRQQHQHFPAGSR